MSSTFGFMDILIMFCGAYLIYSSIQMKRTGEISSVLIGKGYDVKKAKDPEGYIEYMYLKSVILGVIVIAGGAIDFLNDRYWNIPNLNLIVSGIFLLILIVFCKIALDAQKKYLSTK